MTSLSTVLKRLNANLTLWSLPSSKSLSKERQVELKEKVLSAIDSENYQSIIQEVLLSIEMANKAYVGYVTKEQTLTLSTRSGEIISTFESTGYFIPMFDKDGYPLLELDKRKRFRPYSNEVFLISMEGVPDNTIFECSSNYQVGSEYEGIYIQNHQPIAFSRDVLLCL